MWIVLAIPLLVLTPDPRVTEACIAHLNLTKFERLKEPALGSTVIRSASLEEENMCNWHPRSDHQTPAVLFEIPPLRRPAALEVYGSFGKDHSLAMNVALLDEEQNLLKVAPYTSFRMRSGRPTMAFALASNTSARWLLVTGAGNAPRVLSRRAHRNLFTRSLAVTGIEVGDSTTELVYARTQGRVTVIARRYETPAIVD